MSRELLIEVDEMIKRTLVEDTEPETGWVPDIDPEEESPEENEN